jgi:hypothetical protein
MGKIDDKVVTRAQVEQGLSRFGVLTDTVESELDSIRFPAPLSVVCLRLEGVGISTGQLMEWMGASP